MAKDKILTAKKYFGDIRRKYREIVRTGLKKQTPVKSRGCRGKPKHTQSQNLLIALNKHNMEVWDFLSSEEIPFDNNLAEKNIRMVKTEQKISGYFRSQQGGELFTRIKSYLSTLNKQNKGVGEGINYAFSKILTLIKDLNNN